MSLSFSDDGVYLEAVGGEPRSITTSIAQAIATYYT
jgi:hypothetical protein